MPRIVAIIAVVVLATAGPARPLDCVTYGEMPASLGSTARAWNSGPATAAAVGSDLVLVHGDSRIDVYDVAAAADPLLVGSLEDLDHHWQRGLPAVIGSFAYLANGGGAILDLSDPAQPTLAGQLGHEVMGLAARGTLLAASIQEGTVRSTQILDASDPVAPMMLGSVDVGGQPIFLGDRLAVMADGIWIHDLTDPGAPALEVFLQFETSSGGSGPYEWYDTTSVLDAELLPDTLILLTNHYHRTGSWVYGNVTISNRIERRRIDISDPQALVETAYSHVRTTHDIAPFVNYNLHRVGVLMVEGRDFFDPWSADLATIAALPVRQPVPGGLVDLGDGRAAVCDDVNLSVVPFGASPVDNVADPLATSGQTSLAFAGAGIGGGYVAVMSSGEDEMGYPWADLWIHPGPGEPSVNERSWYGEYLRGFGCAGGNVVVGNVLLRVSPDFGLTEHALDLNLSVEAVTLPDEQRLAAVEPDGTLSLHDLADPASPVRRGETEILANFGTIRDLEWRDDLILMGALNGLAVARVEAGWQPVMAGFLALGDVRHVAFLDGDQALLAVGSDLVRVDLADPAAPTVSQVRNAGVLNGPLLVQGDLAYATVDGLLSLLDTETLTPLGTLALDEEIGALDLWNGELVGAGRHFRGFAYLPPACELEATAVGATPPATALLGVHPNPFNPQTTVRFRLTGDQRVSLGAYDLSGRLVRRLAGGVWAAGEHHLRWDGRGDRGESLPAGVYLLRLETATAARTVKAVLVK